MEPIRLLVEAIVDRKTNSEIESLYDRLIGRYTKQDVVDPKSGELIIASDEFITEDTYDQKGEAASVATNVTQLTVKHKEGKIPAGAYEAANG